MESLSSDPVSLDEEATSSHVSDADTNRNQRRRPPTVCSVQRARRSSWWYQSKSKADLKCRRFAEVCANADDVLRLSSGGLAFCPSNPDRVQSHANSCTLSLFKRVKKWQLRRDLCWFIDMAILFFVFFHKGSHLCLYPLKSIEVRQLQHTLYLCGYSS